MSQDFINELARVGIPPTHALVFDGKFRRYNVASDKKGRRNGWYRYVQVRDDFAWAVYGCNKRGVDGKWNSYGAARLTKYDATQIRKKQAEIKKEEEELQGRVAAKANQIWTRLSVLAANAYTTRKKVGIYNAREMSGSLVVPVYENDYIVSLQFITAQGEKRFLSHGKVMGCYGIVAREVTPRIFICEGYSTAATIFEATGDMVILAFFAGNLPAVAAVIREKHPNAAIFIGADNDQFGNGGNAGISYAREAAEKIGAKVVYPDFPADDKQRGTDWNDWYIKHGLDSTRDELLGVKKPKNVPAIADDNLWKTQLIEGKEFRPGYCLFDGKSKANVYAFMANHDWYKGLIVYNDFSDKIMMRHCPPWEKEDKFVPRELIEYDCSQWVNSLEKLGIKTNKDIVNDAILHIAKQNTINPPADYFNSLVWDCVPRLNKWLTYYLGAEKQDAEYLALVGSKWLMAIVARAFNPGTKFDNVLVLEGIQGLKKTGAFEVLATFGNENFFLEFSGDFTNKDSLSLMQGKMIVEMSELASVKRSQAEETKAFISRRIDEYRPPYGRLNIKRPRRFILGGSTNKVGQEYLEDETGARRIWPVECGAVIDLDALRKDQSQLYAEAVARYKSGERIWLEGDEVELAKSEQADRQAEDAWEQKISVYVSHMLETTTAEVGTGIGLTTKDLNNFNTNRIKKCLKNLGWEEYRPGTGKERLRKWRQK